MEKITSRQNPRIKELVKLQERSYRDKMGKFIVEGSRELISAINGGIYIEEVYWSSECGSEKRREEALGALGKTSATLIETTKEVFEKFSNRNNPDGVVGVGWYERKGIEDLEYNSETPLILVLEGVEKPGNLGAIIRSADTACVDAIFCADPATDIYNPNVIRSSQGQVFSMPIFVAGNEEIYDFLESEDIRVVVSTPAANELYWNLDMSDATAIIMGSEKEGVSEFWLRDEFPKAKIPVLGSADSLNLAAASVLFLYEAVRQRTT
jgi:TrmH family RNA methyltransferase